MQFKQRLYKIYNETREGRSRSDTGTNNGTVVDVSQANETNIMLDGLDKKSTKLMINLPNNVPLSSIVYEMDGNTGTDNTQNSSKVVGGDASDVSSINDDINLIVHKFEMIAFKLYIKYIRTGAEFEINIGHSLRDQLTKWARSRSDGINAGDDAVNKQTCVNLQENIKRLNDLYKLFDECITEMVKLMHQSVIQFYHTKVCITL